MDAPWGFEEKVVGKKQRVASWEGSRISCSSKKNRQPGDATNRTLHREGRKVHKKSVSYMAYKLGVQFHENGGGRIGKNSCRKEGAGEEANRDRGSPRALGVLKREKDMRKREDYLGGYNRPKGKNRLGCRSG